METLKAAYSKPGSGTLYWCGFSDEEVPDHVGALIRPARAPGCDENTGRAGPPTGRSILEFLRKIREAAYPRSFVDAVSSSRISSSEKSWGTSFREEIRDDDDHANRNGIP